METMASRPVQNTGWWITSLAISVVCCAIIFVVFAGYLVEVNKSLAVSSATTNVRLEMLEQRQNQLNSDIEVLHRHSVQQIQIMPGSASNSEVPAAAAVSASAPAAPAAAPAKK
jgi:hypothetical protein